MYKYTETIGDLTRSYEAETPEEVVALVLAVTIDVQTAIDAKHRQGAQLSNVDIEELTRRVRDGINADFANSSGRFCKDVTG